MKKLTVAIPTYTRKEILRIEIKRLIENGILENCKILVFNDSEIKFNLNEYQNTVYESEIEVINNGKNSGYANSFCGLIANCKTEFCLIVADDDQINPKEVERLATYLENINSSIVVTQWLGKDGKPAKSLNQGRLNVADIRSAFNHAPGIVYRVSEMESHIVKLKEEIMKGSYAAHFFPQVVLAYSAIDKLEIEFISLVTGGYAEGTHQPSDLKDKNGRGYSDISVVFSIESSLIDFLIRLKQGSSSIDYMRTLNREISKMYFYLPSKIGSLISRDSQHGKFYYAGIVRASIVHLAGGLLGFIGLVRQSSIFGLSIIRRKEKLK